MVTGCSICDTIPISLSFSDDFNRSTSTLFEPPKRRMSALVSMRFALIEINLTDSLNWGARNGRTASASQLAASRVKAELECHGLSLPIPRAKSGHN